MLAGTFTGIAIRMPERGMMRLLCAWSEKEGKPAFIAEVEPKDDPTPTHGTCPAPRAETELVCL